MDTGLQADDFLSAKKLKFKWLKNYSEFSTNFAQEMPLRTAPSMVEG